MLGFILFVMFNLSQYLFNTLFVLDSMMLFLANYDTAAVAGAIAIVIAYAETVYFGLVMMLLLLLLLLLRRWRRWIL